MTIDNDLDPREVAFIEERNKKILEGVKSLKIPGRGFESRPEFSEDRKQLITKKDDGRPDGWVIRNEAGQDQIKETINYRRQKIEGANKWGNTDEVEKITQQSFTRDGQGRVIKEEGCDLNLKNSWEKSFEYDAKGVTEKGKVTEGEKAGETWERKDWQEQQGGYLKKVREITGQHSVDGKLTSFRTFKVNYAGPDGKDFLYRSREYDENGNEIPAKNMDWQKEEGLPSDFKEW